VVIWRDEAALKVPIGALFRRSEQWAAFVIDNDVAHFQIVQLGQRNDSEGQITGGLVEGQIVVLHPPDTLQDGMRVKIRASQ
jgi:HlyD family secretion protein